MRSKRPDGSIRERSDGCFQIRYTLGIDPLTGKRKRVEVTHQGTYESAKVALRRLLKSIDDNDHIEPSKIKVSEFLAQWIETMRSQVSPATHQRYTDIINCSLMPAFGACFLSKLTPAEIQRQYNKWETTGRRDGGAGGIAPRTRIHIHRVFKSALKNAVYLQLIGRNPADFVKPPKAPKISINVLTIEQSAELLEFLRDSCLYWPVLLALATGMRRGEILALRWKNIDFETATVRVVESVEKTRKGGLRFKEPKTGKTRAIVLPQCVLEELKKWKETLREDLLSKNIKLADNHFVCGKSDGEVRDPTTLTHGFIIAINKLKHLPRVRFHDLRHSHATQLLAAGIHPKIAQERLGHSTITTTLDLYSHVTNTMQADAASTLDTAFRSAIKARLLAPKPS